MNSCLRTRGGHVLISGFSQRQQRLRFPMMAHSRLSDATKNILDNENSIEIPM